MKKIFIAALFVLLLHPGIALAKVNNRDKGKHRGCLQAQAIAVAQSRPEVQKWCSAGPQHKCIFRLQSSAGSNIPNAFWVVNASIAHSVDDKGRVHFRPEGSLFVALSEECEILSITDFAHYQRQAN